MANDIIGVKEVRRLLEEVGKAPARVLTKAAKTSAKIALVSARANAPEDTGALKKGIRLKAEKRKKGKSVYQIGFFGRDGTGSEFVKISANGKRSFYPASQEYGWTDEHGNYTPGFRFLRNSIDGNREKIHTSIYRILGEELDKLR